MKRGLVLSAKVGVSLALLTYLFFTTDPTKLVRRVRGGDPLLFATAVVLYVGMLVLSTWRWRLLLQAQGFPRPCAASPPRTWWRPSSTTSSPATSAAT